MWLEVISEAVSTPAIHDHRSPGDQRTKRPKTRILHAALGFPVLLGGLLVAFLSLFLPANTGDPDIWWHLRNVQLELANHSLLTRDAYSFTVSGATWINYEWLAEVPFYAGFRTGGEQGLEAVTFLALATVFIGVYAFAFRTSRNTIAAFISSLVAVFLGTVSFGPRTLLFGWICLVAELLLLNLFESGGRETSESWIWLLPLLFLIWVNTHGSWIIGLAILAAFTFSRCLQLEVGSISNPQWTKKQRRILFLNLGASVAMLFCNPYGWRLVAYPLDMAFRQKLNIASVEEWRTLDFHSPRGRCFFLVLACLFASQLLRPRRWTLYEVALLAIGVYSALTYSRFLFLGAILVMPILTKDLALWIPLRPLPDRPLINGGILAALLVAMHPWYGSRASNQAADTYPVQALGYLRNFHPEGHILNDYLWGGYLIWNTPHLPVFIDSRVDIYERAGVFKDYLAATRIENSLNLLGKYNIRYVLMPKDTPLVYLLKSTREWKLLYEDRTASLLERASGPIPTAAGRHD